MLCILHYGCPLITQLFYLSLFLGMIFAKMHQNPHLPAESFFELLLALLLFSICSACVCDYKPRSIKIQFGWGDSRLYAAEKLTKLRGGHHWFGQEIYPKFFWLHVRRTFYLDWTGDPYPGQQPGQHRRKSILAGCNPMEAASSAKTSFLSWREAGSAKSGGPFHL